jgi:hypothetical protein
VTVVAFAMASSTVSAGVVAGRPLRWAMLALLAVVAIGYGWPERHRFQRSLAAVGAGLGAVAFLSVFWSVTPRITFERAVTFAVLMIGVTFIAAGSVGSRRRLELVLISAVVGPLVVSTIGLLVLVFDYRRAVVSLGPDLPSRFQGFGENPNTDSMLLALVLPIAIWGITSARTSWWRAAAVGAAALLYGPVVASGSRGAMLGAAAGSVVFVLLRGQRLRALIPVTAVLIAFFAASFSVSDTRGPSVAPEAQPAVVTTPSTTAETTTAAATTTSATTTQAVTTTVPSAAAAAASPSPGASRFTDPLAPTPPAPIVKGKETTTGPVANEAETTTGFVVPVPWVPERDEIGFPLLYEYKPILAYGSGRIFAWLSAIRQGLERPLLGYGFGTEQYVFADRFNLYQGSFAENSFVGIFLELGLVGVLLLLAPFAMSLKAAARTVRRPVGIEREVSSLGVAVAAGGFVIAFFQSYLYSVGNVGTLTFWVIVFLGVTIAVPGAGRTSRRIFASRRLVEISVGVAVIGAFLLVALGRHERGHEQAAMLNGIARVRAAIGPSLSHPSPKDYLYSPGRTCLLWGVGNRSYALELCIDGKGRVVESVDRRGTAPKFYSIVEEPGAARMTISPKLFASLVAGVQRAHGIPIG